MKPRLLRWPSLLVCVAATAVAAPEPGAMFPPLQGKDLHGQTFDADSLRGSPALVAVVTDRSAAPAAKRWMEAAEKRFGDDVRRLSVVSLDIPGPIPRSAVASRVKKAVPKPYWDEVLADATGELAEAVGIGESEAPTLLALDADQRILAVVEGPPAAPDAAAIWRALEQARNTGGGEASAAKDNRGDPRR